MSNEAKGRTHLTGATGRRGEVAVRRSFTPNRITRNGTTAPDRDPVAELAKRVGWTAAEVEDAIDELLANDGRSAKYRALRVRLHPDAGTASVSIVVKP